MTDWSLTLTAPAKINLYLGVHTERDARGYHKVDSLMAAVGLVDTVTVTPAQVLTVQTIPASDFPMQKNTAYRAAAAMVEHYGREANVCVTIEKRIPLCAGLAALDGCRRGHCCLGRAVGYRPYRFRAGQHRARHWR